jgi:hypothetical protein
MDIDNADTGQGDYAPGQDAGDVPGGTQVPADTGGQDAYFHTFKTREDAEKGWADRDRQFRDLQRRESEARRKSEQLEKDNQLAATLKVIAEGKSPAGGEGASKAEQIKAAREKWTKQFDQSGNGTQILELLDDYEAARSTGTSSEVAELKKQLAEMTTTLSEYDPTWQGVKQDVDEFGLREKFPNLERKQLAAIAKEMRALKPRTPSQPGRPDLPGRTGGIAGGPAGSTTISPEQFAEIENLTGVKLTAAVKAEMQRREGARQ